MNQKIFISFFLGLGLITSAYAHKAHVHGIGDVKIVFEGLKGEVEFKAPQDSVTGFEHKATSKKDKKAQADMIKHFKEKALEIFKFDSSLGCEVTKKDVEFDYHKTKSGKVHSDFEAEFDIKCAKSPAETAVTLDLTFLKKLEKYDIVVIVDDLQKRDNLKNVQAHVIDLK